MKLISILLLIIFTLFASELPIEDSSNNETSKVIIGTSEFVTIHPGNIKVEARIDTGANSTSLDAHDLEIINEDGVKWAQFTLGGSVVKHKIVKFVRIKQHGRKSQRRPIINLQITLGDVTQVVPVNLTDRSNFKYKMLVGVNFLYDNFIVDVSLKHTIRNDKSERQ